MLKRTNEEGRQSLWASPRPKITWKVCQSYNLSSAKDHDKNYIKMRRLLVCHLLRNRLLHLILIQLDCNLSFCQTVHYFSSKYIARMNLFFMKMLSILWRLPLFSLLSSATYSIEELAFGWLKLQCSLF